MIPPRSRPVIDAPSQPRALGGNGDQTCPAALIAQVKRAPCIRRMNFVRHLPRAILGEIHHSNAARRFLRSTSR